MDERRNEQEKKRCIKNMLYPQQEACLQPSLRQKETRERERERERKTKCLRGGVQGDDDQARMKQRDAKSNRIKE